MAEIPRSHVPIVDAVLRSIDPRLSEAQRSVAASLAEESAGFALGVLSSVLMDHFERVEGLFDLPEGAMTDRLRAKLLEADGEVPGAAPSEESPRPPAEAAGEPRTGTERHEGTSAPLSASPGLSGRHSADERLAREGAALIERTRDAELHYRENPMPGEINGGAEQLARLGQQLRFARAEELAAELEVDEQDEMAWTPSEPAGQPDPWQDPWGGKACGAATSRGPCGLRAGHPAGEGLPGERGHIGGMA